MASPALVREYYLEALDPRRFDRLDTLLTDDDADHETMIGIPPARAGLKTKYPGCGSVDRVALTGGGVSGVPSVTTAGNRTRRPLRLRRPCPGRVGG
jgi:hypothetical protein